MSDESGGSASVIPRTRASIRRGTAGDPTATVEDGSPRKDDWRAQQVPSSLTSTRSLAALLLGGGGGVLAAVGATASVGNSSALLAPSALWTGMLAAVVYVLVAQRAPGLFHLRFADLLWGLGLAVVLRFAAGFLTGANSEPFPVLLGASQSFESWVLTEGVPSALIGPVTEELFFRAALLVVLYQVIRGHVGTATASAVSILVSAGSFVLLHLIFSTLTGSDALQVFLLGIVTSALVLLTGRVWGAILLHIGYNTSFILLAAVGSLLA